MGRKRGRGLPLGVGPGEGVERWVDLVAELEPATTLTLAAKAGVTRSTARVYLAELRRGGLVREAGKDGHDKLWATT